MGKRFLWQIIGVLLLMSCGSDEPSTPVAEAIPIVRVLEGEQTDYRLEWHIQVLADTQPGYTLEDILQPAIQDKFQSYPDYTSDITNYQHYWGKLQLENRLTHADQYTEWILSFTDTWTSLDFYIQEADGTWRQEPNGAFTSERLKSFAPTARGNLVKLILPPQEPVTVYFRGISERTAIYPSFYTRLKHIETFYNDLLKTKVSNALFIGFLLMMLFYNLLVSFFGRDRSFIFYSAYLFMVVVYSTYSSEDLVDWFGLFAEHPAYLRIVKLSLYLAMMCYLAFIRSFLDLEKLLPKWDKVFKFFIYLGFPLILLDIIVIRLTNFSYVVEDRIVVPYIILMIIICCGLLYPLYKTRDKKGYFIIAGIGAVCVGAILTVISRVWLPPFSLFYLKAGTIVEILFFSLGLAYRQRQQRQAKQLADFKLRESQLIQEKQQLEANRLKELNDFKARFYTNITHEFRTPLTVIMGVSEQISKHEKEKELIQRNSKNLLRLINQLLDLSKLESGTLALNKVHQDIIVYLQYLTESFYSTAMQKDIRLVFHSEEKTMMMDYDEEKIQQIVYNLLSNALKFTQANGRIIFHASKVEEEDRPYLKLKVKDTGIGIPAEYLNSIFDRFYQVDRASKGQESSTGIGLALVKELVELMNGRIQVESQVGEGTEFILYLPIESQAKIPAALSPAGRHEVRQTEPSVASSPDVLPETASTAEALEGTEAPLRSDLPELLIIEDNQDIVIYIESILKEKYRIHTATNGNLGIEKAWEIIPDIIISDVMMPEKSGYEVCEILKQDERSSHIPIILLTAKATQEDRIHGLQYGADAYLTKPFDKEELIIRLEKLVEMRRQLQLRYSNSTIPPQTSTPSVDDNFLQKLRQYIQANLNDAEFGVSQLAEAIPMSQMQLYRKLKALTGKTPSQFIRSYRLQQAIALLQNDDLTVSEVAYEVGFADPSYFSRVFQKEFGKSPSSFLK